MNRQNGPRMKTETPPLLVGSRTTADACSFSLRKLDELCANGCPHILVGRRKRLFDLGEVLAWLKRTRRVCRKGPAANC